MCCTLPGLSLRIFAQGLQRSGHSHSSLHTLDKQTQVSGDDLCPFQTAAWRTEDGKGCIPTPVPAGCLQAVFEPRTKAITHIPRPSQPLPWHPKDTLHEAEVQPQFSPLLYEVFLLAPFSRLIKTDERVN